MQKFIVTYLATIILFQGIFVNTDVLFEINELLEDYQLHKTKYGDNTYTFLSKHFGDLKESHKKQHQEEHEQHKHPSQDKLANVSQFDYTFNRCNFTIKNVVEINADTSNFHYSDLFSTFEKQKIFQPPKLT